MKNVAIDGPAGAGKSTIAKLLAKKLNYMYINTGAMYRAVTYVALKNQISEKDYEGLKNIISKMDIEFVNDDLVLNGINIQGQLETPYISSNVSKYAAERIVRQELVSIQQKIAENYDVVMDGRDIGTVVLKDSKYKFYLTASAQERARRRYNELLEKNNKSVNYEDILTSIIERDQYDSTREIDPLKMAQDAILIDSTKITIDDVVNKMLSYIV